MESLAYGLFDSRNAADAAIAGIESHGLPRDVVSVVEHAGMLDEQDIQGPGTRSRTYAWVGGGTAAVLGTIIGTMMFGSGSAIGYAGVAVLAGAGAGALGALVSAMAGAAIPRKELEALGREIEGGKVLVTIDVQRRRAARKLLATLEQYGAVRAGVL